MTLFLPTSQQEKAPFSFHCRICYERLNLTDRPPVVLPCGHTYICQICSQKLTRCMECRKRITPLPPPKPQPSESPALNIDASRQYPHGHIVRKSYRQRQQEQRQNYYLQKEQERLARARQIQEQEFPVPTTVDELHTVLKKTADVVKPELPKNVVLMSLMEAAQEKLPQEKKWKNFNAEEDPEEEEDDGYESGDDDDMVISGLRAVSSSYGTYVVKAKEGLWVYDMKPVSLSTSIPMSRSGSHSSRNSATGSSGSIQPLLPPTTTGSPAASIVTADPPGKSPYGKSPRGQSPPGQMLLPKHPNHHQIVPQQLQLKLLQHQQQKENEEPVSSATTSNGSISAALTTANLKERASSPPTPTATATATTTPRKAPPSPEHIKMKNTIREQMQSMESRVSKLRELNKQSTSSTLSTAAMSTAASTSTSASLSMGLSSSERGSSSTRQRRSSGSGGGGGRNSARSRSRSRTKSPSSAAVMTKMDPNNTSFMSISSVASTNVASNVVVQQQPQPQPPQPKPIERLIHGQTVQIVYFDPTECIAQLARGGGYIRVDKPEDELVKVGEPTDEACKIEGIILSVGEERRQHKKQINALLKLEKRLHTNLRSFFVREAEELEEKRQQAKLEQQERQRLEKEALLNTSIGSTTSGRTAASVAEELLAEDSDDDEHQQKYPGNLTPPSTPPPGLLEMSPSGMSSGPDDTPSSRGIRSGIRGSGGGVGRQLRYDMADGTPTAALTNNNKASGGGGRGSSSRSGISAPANTPVANKKKRDPKSKGAGVGVVVEDDDDGEEKKTDSQSESSSPTVEHAAAWHDNDIFTQGCDLFFCATMPLCIGHNTVSATDLSVTAGIPYTSSILGGQPSSSSPTRHHRRGGGGGDGMMGSPYRNSTSRRYQYNHRHGGNREPDYVVSASSPPGIPHNESYGDGSNIDGGGSHISAGSGGVVDFATGLSGHTGISRNLKRRGTAPRKQVRMMSQHDGIAHIRRPKNTGGASVISTGGCSRASAVTL